MKKYRFRLYLRITLVVLFACSTGFAVAYSNYWIIGVCILALVISVYHLVHFQKRSTDEMQKLINAIRFNEFNISFDNFESKGLASELRPKMNNAIKSFNQRMQQITARQNFYDILLNRIDFAILVVDRTGNIEWINKAALDIFGKPHPRKLYDLARISLNLPEELDLLIPKETRILRFGADRKQLQMAATALMFSQEGKNLKLISLKNIDSVLEESESDAWKKLIRILTHEIMNSLSPIISLSETFSEPEPETRDMVFQAMQTIQRRSKGLIDFINNYQKLTKIPAPEKTIFPLNTLFDDIQHLLRADNLNFTYQLQDNDMQLKADRTQIEQVLINLIKNACESSATSTPANVVVRISKDNYQRTLIQIEDNGQGILPEVLDKIFVPFFTTKSTGSGIGLSICRQIINMHGGSITVSSEPEKGSTFSIVI